MKTLAWTIVAIVFSSGILWAQLGGRVENANEVLTLGSLAESLVSVDVDIASQRQALDDASTEAERSSLYEDLQALREKRRKLINDFSSVATGIELTEFENSEGHRFDLAKELNELLEPIVRELKDVTEQPRVIEELRNAVRTEERRLATANEALSKIQEIEPSIQVDATRARLMALQEEWEGRASDARNRLSVLRHQLDDMEAKQQSVFDAGTSALTAFFRSRGRNLFLTITTFFGVFFLLRFLQRYVERVGPVAKRKERTPFAARLLHVAFHVFTFVGALASAMIVLYASGDWVLMGLAIIMIAGLVLAAKNALPRFLEQARLVLNLGEVREGERLIFDGIPWKVERLSFYTTLTNPELTGGLVRLPLRQLGNLISRPIAEGELWFPCRAGDWVLLSDDTRGRVLTQTPEMVHLVLLGGTKVSYPTADFLSLSPKNLSANFRLKSVFGIDYQYQAIATTEVPSKLWKKLMTELVKVIDREHIIDIKVEFKQAGASSLDYEIIADIDGAVASKYEMLSRALQRISVDACNENGWEIPFTQMTVHHKRSQDIETATSRP